MRSVPRETTRTNQEEAVVDGAPKDVLAHRAPAIGGWPQSQPVPVQSTRHGRGLDGHQPRSGVRPPSLVGDPIGAQVAFLEDMAGQAQIFCDFAGDPVNGSAGAIADNVSDSVACDPVPKSRFPRIVRFKMCFKARKASPEHAISKRKSDAPHLRSGELKMAGEGSEERPVWSLKKEETACHWTSVLALAEGPVTSTTCVDAAQALPRW